MKQLLLILVLFITGCVAEYEDVSESVEYKGLIGGRFILKKNMYMSGVNAPPGYSEVIDFYSIDPIDRAWSGRELITRETLNAGNVFKINKIRRCTNCLDFSEIIKATVSLESFETKVVAPIYIRLKNINSGSYVERIRQPHNKSLKNGTREELRAP